MSDEQKDANVRNMYRKKVEAGEEEFQKEIFGSNFVLERTLRYGENPGGPAAFYREVNASGPGLATFEMLQESPGKEMSFNNFLDGNAAIRIVRREHKLFPSYCIIDVIKHTNPTGVARSDDTILSFRESWETDPISAYGGIICVNSRVDDKLAKEMIDKHIELLIAPEYTSKALDVLKGKKDLRVMQIESLDTTLVDDGYDYKRVDGGLLVQRRPESRINAPENLEVISRRQPNDSEISAALFTWPVVFYTKSNAIVIGYPTRALGVGEGQPNRYDSAKIALERRDKYTNAKDGLLASDAFFPFPDTVELAGHHGITALMFPLGSMRDQEAIDAGNKYNMAMMVPRPIPGDKSVTERAFYH